MVKNLYIGHKEKMHLILQINHRFMILLEFR